MTELGGATDGGNSGRPKQERDGPIRVLVVDDEDGVRNAIARVLRRAGMEPTTADGGEAAFDLFVEKSFDVVLLDVRMPGMTGPQILSRMKAAGVPSEVIMMTACADIATTVGAVKAGAYGILTKPFAINEFIVIEVINAAECKRLRERNALLQKRLVDGEARLAEPGPVRADIVGLLALEELAYMDAKKCVLAKFRRAYFETILRLTGGDLSEAARRSGLRPAIFERLVEAHAVGDAEK